LYFYCIEVKEPVIAYSQQKISIETYLEMENAALEKHEYYKGEIFAMSGAKLPHNTITRNLLTALGQKLKGKNASRLAAIYEYTFHQIHYSLILIFLFFVAK
jgi:hypothetical protein